MRTFRPGALMCAFFFASTMSIFAQGSLTPPGPPASALKTLQQIEPRIDLQNAPASAVDTANVAYHFIISQPGSYYLSANLGVTKTNGIKINAEGVTLDLNGFQVSRASGSGGSGIEIPGTSHRASIRNGSIKGFTYGVFSWLGPVYPRACVFRDLSVSSCTDIALLAGQGSVLESCRAHNNSGSYGLYSGFGSLFNNCTATNNMATGIYANIGSSLTNCTATGNTGDGIYANIGSSLTNCTATGNTGNGIFGEAGSTLTNCSASDNSAHGIHAEAGSSLINCSAYQNRGSYGIFGGAGSTLTNCAASSNTNSGTSSYGIHAVAESTVVNCTSTNNNNTNGTLSGLTGVGIFAGDGSTVKVCTVQGNTGDGIRVENSGLVLNNNSDGNGYSTGDGAGIHATGTENRIDGNKVSNNDRGIDVDGDRNFIIRNTARENLTGGVGRNYVIVTGNRVGVIIIPDLSGDIAGDSDVDAVGVKTTDPWANFTY